MRNVNKREFARKSGGFDSAPIIKQNIFIENNRRKLKHLYLRLKIISDARGDVELVELGRALIGDVSGSQLSATTFNMEDELDNLL